MGWPATLLLIAAVAGMSGCSASLSSQERSSKLTAGFWFWNGSSTGSALLGEPLDSLFVHVGTVSQEVPRPRWHAYGQWPDELPIAKEYWLVFRYERQGVPDLQVAPMLAGEVSRLQGIAMRRHFNVAGVQLDIDSPTGSLAQYASFLREVRKELPQGMEMSITALLDWFRSGTALAEVIKETDEFVPQFYDVDGRESYSGGSAIAARIDAARWGPVFNRFRKRFRVGISTFGRARMVPRDAIASTGQRRLAAYYGDLLPIDLATNPVFALQASNNQANELALTYRATRKTQISYNRFEPGDAVQFIVSTPDAVRAAVESARRMEGHMAGVVFFRWPSSNEPLAMQPNEVLVAAGFRAREQQGQNRIAVFDGRCAAVECVDLYFESADPFSPKPVRYRIRSSTELEYFLPEKKIPVRMTGPSDLELSLPPYCARGRLYLGRAVSAHRVEFTVEEDP